ncbi:unnamed protein product [marine sediment metagenome]|uniref:Uncharacterized protein n=1 Tax=marine sediment metagenome TaxID=412755 RepID=X0XLH8_9ZZZZ
MEQRVNINGKTWIVPANQVPALIGWLSANAVDAQAMQQVTEVTTEKDGTQLLCE